MNEIELKKTVRTILESSFVDKETDVEIDVFYTQHKTSFHSVEVLFSKPVVGKSEMETFQSLLSEQLPNFILNDWIIWLDFFDKEYHNMVRIDLSFVGEN